MTQVEVTIQCGQTLVSKQALPETCMTNGAYNKNSSFQQQVVTATAPLLWAATRRAAAALCPTAHGVFNVADLGCSQGKNSLAPCRTVVRALEEHRSLLKDAAGAKAPPGQLSVMVYHEDLPSQDWATLFSCVENDIDSYLQLPKPDAPDNEDRISVFSAAIGRTFYQRLFPDQFVHLAFSFSALMWMRGRPEMPPGPRTIYYYSNKADPVAKAAASESAVNDLAHILRLRAEEMSPGARFVAGYPGCPPHGLDGQPEEFMEEALGSLLDDGRMTQEQLAAIAVQLYLPRPCEVHKALKMVDDLWEVEAGFGAEADTLLLPGWQAYADGEITAAELGEQYSEFWRAVTEGQMTAMLVAAGTEAGAAAELLAELYRRIQRAAECRPKALYMYPVFGTLVRKA